MAMALHEPSPSAFRPRLLVCASGTRAAAEIARLDSAQTTLSSALSETEASEDRINHSVCYSPLPSLQQHRFHRS